MSDDVDRDIGQSDNEAHPFDTEFLDDTSDAHATLFGFWRGVRSMSPTPKLEESKKELHYFRFGYLLGTAVQGAVVLFGAKFGLGL